MLLKGGGVSAEFAGLENDGASVDKQLVILWRSTMSVLNFKVTVVGLKLMNAQNTTLFNVCAIS